MVLYLCSRFCIFDMPVLEEYVFHVEGGQAYLLQSCLRAVRNGLPLVIREMHPFFEILSVIGTPNLQAFLMDIHHDTSLRCILENDYISLTSKVHICSCSNKKVGLWLVVKSFIGLFCIAHFIFTLALCFHLSLI
jgi:hypothetical protein